MNRTMYRPTKSPMPGEYYVQLNDRQVRSTLARWERRRLSGKLSGQEMCQVMAHKANPDWNFWRRVLRIRNDHKGLHETYEIVVLPPTTRFRAVKNKPSPVK